MKRSYLASVHAAALCALAAGATMAAGIPPLVQTCIACHEQSLKTGDPPASVPKLRRQHTEYMLIALREYRSGTRTDPVMRAVAQNLSDADLLLVAAWFQAGDKPRPQTPAAHPMPKIVRELCEPCHGRTGLASTPEMPIIGGQHEDYLLATLQHFQNGQRKSPVMSVIVANLLAADLAEGAAYYSPQPPMLDLPKDFEERANAATSVPVEQRSVSAPRSIKRLSLAAAARIEMVDIPAGEFMMGSPALEGDSPGVPRHRVTVPAFRLGKYDVTFDQYDAFARATRRALPNDEGYGRGRNPVFNVDWSDTQAYIQWLNRRTGRHFRLPTEAEWEYAARAGTTTHYWWGDKPDFTRYNSYMEEGPDRWRGPSPVGSFPPSPWGLYDIVGNVLQRVTDCKKATYDGAPTDGSAWVFEPCPVRIMRGGSWYNFGGGARAATRSGVADPTRSTAIGFRLAE
jgi:formylglycine-generating enzyme required for sulfatase activity/mono/diheme cytochrome c family protein